MKKELKPTTPRAWAIQTSNSKFRTWKHTSEESRIIFHWDVEGIKRNSNEEEIYRILSEKNLAAGVYNYLRVKIGDTVWGVTGERILNSVGKVTEINKELKSNKITISIDWQPRFGPIKNSINVFSPDAEIEAVAVKIVDEKIKLIIERPKLILKKSKGIWLSKSSSSSDDYIPMDAPLDPPPMLSPETVGETSSEIKETPVSKSAKPPEKKASNKDDGGLVSLFYGTNRDLTCETDFNDFYGNELSELKFGRCVVSIPKGHVEGKMERPKYYKLEFRENEDKHIMIKNLLETKEDVFFQKFNEDLENVDQKAALIFVHGYNNSFADGARRAGQIAWDMPFKGVTGFFSWPSRGNVLSYLTDADAATSSIPSFQEFIEKIVFNTGVEKIHFIAHSMGNTLLTATLNNLSQTNSLKEKINIIHQIVMGAPDVAQNIFKATILPTLKNIGKRRTLYASDRDMILKIAEILRLKKPRLGDAGKFLFVSDNLDTVDASNINSEGLFEHGYVFNAKELLSDLHMLINLDLSPGDRRLMQKQKDELDYWLFKE